jgi:hypothetical protein
MEYVEIVRVDTVSQARVLAAALRAHGFNPREPGDGGLPGVTNLFSQPGYPVEVPEDQANDAGMLARQIAADMRN